MKSAFDATVPRRKPRTRLGIMLAESEPEAAREQAEESLPAEASNAVPPEPSDLPRDHRVETPREQPIPVQPEELTEMRRQESTQALREEPAPVRRETPATSPAPGGETLQHGRARIAELRARLEAAKKKNITASPEPALTASKVRETVASLRGRLEQSTHERAGLLETLGSTRRVLKESQEALESERRLREESETLAEERSKVASGLLLESEALAEERDQALARIVELKELEAQQRELLDEMEAHIAGRDRLLAEAETKAVELRTAIDAAAAEIETVHARFEEQAEENRVLRSRVAELESDVRRSANAREALSEIQKLVDALA